MRTRTPIIAVALACLALSGCGYIGAAVLSLTAGNDSSSDGGARPGAVNSNTTAEIVDVPRSDEAVQNVVIRLKDPEGDAVPIQLEYREDGFTAFLPAKLARVLRLSDGAVVFEGPFTETPPLPGTPDGTDYGLQWLFAEDFGGAAPRAGVTLRLSIVGTLEAPGGVAFTSEAQSIGNERPAISGVAIVGSRNIVLVRFRLRDSTSDTIRVRAFFRIAGAPDRQVLTPLDPIALATIRATPVEQELSFAWDTSDRAQVGAITATITVELEAEDEGGLVAVAAPSPPTIIGNNRPPQALVIPPPRATSGTAVVEYALIDSEGDAADIVASWELDGVPGSGGLATQVGGDSTVGVPSSVNGSIARTFAWDYAGDLLNQNALARVRFRIEPQTAGAAAGVAAFFVGNDPPRTTFASAPASAAGEALFTFSIEDTSADLASIVAEYSTNGTDFFPATSASATIGLATTRPGVTPAIVQEFRWQTLANLPAAAGDTVAFRITANDGLPRGLGDGANAAVAMLTVNNQNPTPPDIASVTPAVGRTAGGTPVTIVGSGFIAGGTAVTFDGVAATGVQVQSASALTATTPAGTTGPADVTVTTTVGMVTIGSDTLAGGFTYQDGPEVFSVTPADGPIAGGTLVTIAGAGFVPGATTVTVGGVALEGALVAASGLSITGTTPSAAAGAGAATVIVTTAAGQAVLAGGFRYLAAPAVTAVTPAKGPLAGGIGVTVSGTAFLASTPPTVLFGTEPLGNVVVANATTIAGTLPAATAGAGAVAVSVTTRGGMGSLTSAFTYVAAPTVTSISPAEGLATGGTTVTIAGTGFQTGTDETAIAIGGNPLSIASVTPTQVIGTTPAGAVGLAAVVATTAGGSATLMGSGFTYAAPVSIALVSPTGGPTAGGTTITVTGTGFRSGITAVSIGGIAATNVVVQNGGLLTAVTPAGAAGARDVTVTVTGATPETMLSATATGAFTYRDPPVITGVTPVDGPLAGATSITIAGARLAGATVTVGGLPLGTPSIAPDGLSITGLTPARATPGAVAIVVTTSQGQASLTNGFTYLAAPDVTAVSPQRGPTAGAIAVTVTGTAFLASEPPTVLFGAASLTNVAVPNATTITGTLPAGTGTVSITVTTRGGTDTLPSAFTYIAPPTLDATTPITPSTGSGGGGDTVTIAGTGFGTVLADVAVTIGGNPVTITSLTDVQIVGTTPPGFTGAADLAVTTPGGTALRANAFTYAGTLAIASVTPGAGTPAGGTLVTIVGSGFSATPGQTTVRIGTTQATSVVVVSPTVLTARTPAGTRGAKDVVVTIGGAGGASAMLAGAFAYRPAVSLQPLTIVAFGERDASAAVTAVLQLDAAPLGTTVTIGIADAGTGTATSNLDYAPVSASPLSFPASAVNGATLTRTISIRDDRRVESDETIFVRLTESGDNAMIEGPDTARVIIRDDDIRVTSFTATPTRVEIQGFGPVANTRSNLAWTFLGSTSTPLALDSSGSVQDVSGLTNINVAPFSSLGAGDSVVDPRVGYKFGAGAPGTNGLAGQAFEVGLARRFASASGGATGLERVKAIAALPDGGAVIVGDFEGTLSFGGTPPDLVAAGPQDFFVARLDAAGDVVSAVRGGGPGTDAARAVCVLPDGSAVVVAAVLPGTTFLVDGAPTDGGFGVSPLAILKYSPANEIVGLTTARTLAGGAITANAVAAFPDGGFVVTGSFTRQVSFGEAQVGFTISLNAPVGQTRAFIARYGPDVLETSNSPRDLEIRFAVAAGGADGTDIASAEAVAAYPDGSCVVGGTYVGDATFSAITLPGSGVFVTRYDAAGMAVWARSGNSLGDEAVAGIAALPNGDAVVAGRFASFISFADAQGGSVDLLSGDTTDQLFVVQYSVIGSLVNGALTTSNGSGGFVRPAGIVSFPDSSVIVTGTYSDSAAFGTVTSPRTITASGASGTPDIFVARYGTGGFVELRQVSEVRGSGAEDARGVAALPDGRFFIAGELAAATTFGIDDETPIAVSPADAGNPGDLFVARYAGMSYRLLEVRPKGLALARSNDGFASGDTSTGNAIAFFPDGSFVVAGGFDGTEDFGAIRASAGLSDAYVARYNAVGDLVWVRTIGGAGSDVAFAVAALPDGSTVVTGRIGDDADVEGGTPLTAVGTFDSFLARYDPDGNVLLARRDGASTGAGSAAGKAIAVLPGDGGFYIVGEFTGEFQAGTTTIINASAASVFVLRCQPDGTPSRSRVLGSGATTVNVAAAAARPTGQLAVAGSFTGTLTVRSNDGTTFASLTDSTTGAEKGDAFVAQLEVLASSSTGNPEVATRFAGATGQDRATGVAFAGDGSLVVTGDFDTGISVDDTTPAATLTAMGTGREVFIASLRPGTIPGVDVGFLVSAGGAGTDSAGAGAAGTGGDLVIAGAAGGDASFVGTSGSPFTLVDPGAFVARYRVTSFTTLSFLEARRVTSAASVVSVNGAAVLPGDGSVAVTGDAAGTAVFGPGEGNATTVGPLGNANPHAFRAKVFRSVD